MKRLPVITGVVCCLSGVFVAFALAASGGAVASKSIHSARDQVVVKRGQPVQIVVAVDDTGSGAAFAPSIREAVQMAVERHPRIRGFAIQVNALSATCDNGSAASLADNASVANAVVSNPQYLAVLGHMCSAEAIAWLPIYETAGIATINGSTTRSGLVALGPTVFNGTTIPDPAFTDTWYPIVKELPSDLDWRARFEARFGSPPADFADLYYDAANVLLTSMRENARIVHRNLVIDRAALAGRVRHTRGFPGVTCTVTLDPTTGYRVDDPAALARCAHAKGRHD